GWAGVWPGSARALFTRADASRLCSGRFAWLALVLRQVVVAGRAPVVGVEVVHGDRVQGQLAQFLELLALVCGDPAFAHPFVQLRTEIQRFDAAGLECLEELAFHRLGRDRLGQVAVDAATHVVRARRQEDRQSVVEGEGEAAGR